MGNNKRKKRPEAQSKENKQEKKRKIISITALAVCVILIVGAVLFIVLNDRIIASKLLKETSGFVEKENIEAIVVSNDTVGDPLKSGVQDVYENEEMAQLKNALITVLKNSKYKEYNLNNLDKFIKILSLHIQVLNILYSFVSSLVY